MPTSEEAMWRQSRGAGACSPANSWRSVDRSPAMAAVLSDTAASRAVHLAPSSHVAPIGHRG
jgi:hypothetical protein